MQDIDDKSAFDSAVRALEFEIANAGTHLTIDATAHFPDDSSAKILTSGLLGDQYIGLEPGADDANFAAGATITAAARVAANCAA